MRGIYNCDLATCDLWCLYSEKLCCSFVVYLPICHARKPSSTRSAPCRLRGIVSRFEKIPFARDVRCRKIFNGFQMSGARRFCRILYALGTVAITWRLIRGFVYYVRCDVRVSQCLFHAIDIHIRELEFRRIMRMHKPNAFLVNDEIPGM